MCNCRCFYHEFWKIFVSWFFFQFYIMLVKIMDITPVFHFAVIINIWLFVFVLQGEQGPAGFPGLSVSRYGNLNSDLITYIY
jgi:hypothetical protein